MTIQKLTDILDLAAGVSAAPELIGKARLDDFQRRVTLILGIVSGVIGMLLLSWWARLAMFVQDEKQARQAIEHATRLQDMVEQLFSDGTEGNIPPAEEGMDTASTTHLTTSETPREANNPNGNSNRSDLAWWKVILGWLGILGALALLFLPPSKNLIQLVHLEPTLTTRLVTAIPMFIIYLAAIAVVGGALFGIMSVVILLLAAALWAVASLITSSLVTVTNRTGLSRSLLIIGFGLFITSGIMKVAFT